MAVVNTIEHYLFREYSIAIKKWLENNVYLHRYPIGNNVKVIYGTPERAWAEYVYPAVNGGSLTPNINFHLTEMEYVTGENFLGFVKEYKTIDGVNITVPPPLVYKLTYSATFFARTQAELDIMFYQMLSKAHQNRKAAFIVDGQWAELEATSPTYETEMEPPSSEDVVRRGSISFTVERAYLPLEIDLDAFTRIEEVDMIINGE